jgi:hypothetical protein
MHVPDLYLLCSSSFGFIFRVREDAAKFRPIEGYSMSPSVKAQLASFVLVLLAGATMSAETVASKPAPTPTPTPAIVYHGGPVMTANPVNVYLIWYGNWNATGSDTPATQSLVEHFVSTFGGSPLALVNTLYSDTTGSVSGNYLLGGPGATPAVQQAFSSTFDTTTPTSNQISAFAATMTSTSTTSTTTTSTDSLSGSTSLKTTTKKNITNGGIEKLVANTLNNGQLPRDPNGVYFVLTSSDINESSGFCGTKAGFCGWHTHADMGGVDIKFAFVGNPDRCPSLCEKQTTGPNSTTTGVGGGDGMVNIIAHELSETSTDPDQNAWFNTATFSSTSAENADACDFTFQSTDLGFFWTLCGQGTSLCTQVADSAGAHYNQTFGNNNWLIQELGEPNQTPPSCVQHL